MLAIYIYIYIYSYNLMSKNSWKWKKASVETVVWLGLSKRSCFSAVHCNGSDRVQGSAAAHRTSRNAESRQAAPHSHIHTQSHWLRHFVPSLISYWTASQLLGTLWSSSQVRWQTPEWQWLMLDEMLHLIIALCIFKAAACNNMVLGGCFES